MTYTYPGQVTELRCDSRIPTVVNVEYTYTGYSTPIGLPKYVLAYILTTPGFTYRSFSITTQTPTSVSAAPSSTVTSTFATSTLSQPSVSSLSVSTTAPPISTTSPASASSATPSPPISPNSSSSPALPIGVIAGGAVGGLAIIVALIALVLWLRYRGKQRHPYRHNNQKLSSTHTSLKNSPLVMTKRAVAACRVQPRRIIRRLEMGPPEYTIISFRQRGACSGNRAPKLHELFVRMGASE